HPTTLLSLDCNSAIYIYLYCDHKKEIAKCHQCATPSTGGNTASEANSKAVKNGVSSKSTRYISPTSSKPPIINGTNSEKGLLPPRKRLQPKESQTRPPLRKSPRPQ